MTVINQRNRDKVREQVAGKKYKPLDLRGKKTRAIRRRLTDRQKNLKTLRQVKKENNFPLRKFALRSQSA